MVGGRPCYTVEFHPSGRRSFRNERIVHTDVFDDPSLPGEMRVTITFRAVSVGTESRVEQAGIPSPIPLEACYLGWQASLQLLTLMVSAEVPADEVKLLCVATHASACRRWSAALARSSGALRLTLR